MFTSSKTNSVVGLDVEAGSLAAAEVRVNGSVEVAKAGILPLEPGVFREGEVSDHQALATALKELFAEHKLSKTVRLGIANQRVAVRHLRLPLIEEEEELETAIRFQAQDHIPMPLEHAVLDYQIISRTAGEGGDRRMEVVVVAARRDMLDAMLEVMRSAGLRPVGVDLSAFGMIRALSSEQLEAAPADTSYEERLDGEGADMAQMTPATLYCNLGDVTNLAVARGSSCLFTRISPYGVEGIAQRLAERRELTLEHARKWLNHVGLERPTEAIEGDPETIEAARDVLAEGAAKLADELRMSLEFYGTQEGAAAVEGVLACGPGSTLAGLPVRLERELGKRVEIGRPPALGHLEDAEAARLTLSYGLALEE